MKYQDLSKYQQEWFSRGRATLVVLLWFFVQATLFRFSPHFANRYRAWILRRFGARMGKNTIIRPSVRITYPWKVSIGDNVWIGEEAYLHSLGEIDIGDNAVVSQRAFLSTGSHDYGAVAFDLVVKPIRIEQEAWVSAQCFVAPGVTVGRGAVVKACSVVVSDLPGGMVCGGNPCVAIKERRTKPQQPAA